MEYHRTSFFFFPSFSFLSRFSLKIEKLYLKQEKKAERNKRKENLQYVVDVVVAQQCSKYQHYIANTKVRDYFDIK